MKFTILCLLSILVFIPVTAQARDWGNSNNLFIKKTLNERWSFVSRGLFASRDDMSDIFFGTIDGGLRYKVNDIFSMDAVYRGVWFDLGEDWGYENRPLINFNFKERWKGYTWNHRSRFEFRFSLNRLLQ